LLPDENEVISLPNIVIEIPKEAKLKVKIRKNNQKTTKDFTEELFFKQFEKEEPFIVETVPKPKIKAIKEEPEKEKNTPYYLLGGLVLLIIIIILKKL